MSILEASRKWRDGRERDGTKKSRSLVDEMAAADRIGRASSLALPASPASPASPELTRRRSKERASDERHRSGGGTLPSLGGHAAGGAEPGSVDPLGLFAAPDDDFVDGSLVYVWQATLAFVLFAATSVSRLTAPPPQALELNQPKTYRLTPTLTYPTPPPPPAVLLTARSSPRVAGRASLRRWRS